MLHIIAKGLTRVTMVQRRKALRSGRDSKNEHGFLQDHTDWALWRLSLVLAEIAGNISGDNDYSAGNLPALDGEYQDGEKRKEEVSHGK